MKKIKISLILLCVIILHLTSCYKCKKLDFLEQTETSKIYFGKYQENTIWIYCNKDSTNIDTISIQNYDIQRRKERFCQCVEYDEFTFNLKNTYLDNWGVSGKISQLQFNENTCFLLEYPYNKSFYVVTDLHGLLLNDQQLVHSFRLKTHPDKLYDSVIVQDNKLWFAPHVGLIQYVNCYDYLDTLYLQKFYKAVE